MGRAGPSRDDPKTKQPNPTASRKQRVIGRIMTAVERVRVDSETNLRDILDKVDEIIIDHVDDTHFFTLSQVYEELLLKMGEKNSDGGQFFTPREVIRAMVHTSGPKLGDTVYDPCCGTGGFLAVAYEHITRNLGAGPASTDIDHLKHDTFFGREKENLVFPIALANLVLHGIDQPNLWHGNTLTGRASYGALFDKAPKTFNLILTNPPFGGKEGKDAQKNYAYATRSTQVIVFALAGLPNEGSGNGQRRCGHLARASRCRAFRHRFMVFGRCGRWRCAAAAGRSSASCRCFRITTAGRCCPPPGWSGKNCCKKEPAFETRGGSSRRRAWKSSTV